MTDAPTAQWTAQQLVEAFPWETAPRYLLRDRDAVYGVEFSSRVQAMGIREVKTAPRSPWQNPYVERLIGTLRRECLDHIVVLNDAHLRRLLRDYLLYYHSARTHLSLDKDAPEPRPVERPDQGRIVETPMVGGLHHRYTARRRKISPARWRVPATLSPQARGFASLSGVLLPSRRPCRSPKWARNTFHLYRSWRPRRGVPDRQPPAVSP